MRRVSAAACGQFGLPDGSRLARGAAAPHPPGAKSPETRHFPRLTSLRRSIREEVRKMKLEPGPYVLPLGEVALDSLEQVGGKNASLGELIQALRPRGVRVPDGFAVTADAFRAHLGAGRPTQAAYADLEQLDVDDVDAVRRVGERIRRLVRSLPLPEEVAAAVRTAYRDLSREYGEEETDVAVRSSATAEDLPDASFAGQQDTYLNVRGEAQVLETIRTCMASLFTDRAIVYRAERGFAHHEVALSVGVQKMVRSDLASAGVIFTLDTETGFRDVVLVTGAWGLGETVVQGRVDPDEYWVHKTTARDGYQAVLRREVGNKGLKLVYAEGGTKQVREDRVPAHDRRRLVLEDAEVLELARWAMAIEDHYTQRGGSPDSDGHRVGEGRPHGESSSSSRPAPRRFTPGATRSGSPSTSCAEAGRSWRGGRASAAASRRARYALWNRRMSSRPSSRERCWWPA